MPRGIITRLLFHLRRPGTLPGLIDLVSHRLWPAQPKLAAAVLGGLQGQTGLEIGGPSRVFQRGNILPVYACAARIDNVNFSSATAWESGLREGGDFRFDAGKPPGRQFLREATDLARISNASCDFVLSSHCLEHVANPLAALNEWRRVTREDGHLLLILPDPRHTFDHRRPVTTFAHLREDLVRRTGEDDLTHLPEILTKHDLTRDPSAGSPEEFRTRGLQNARNRCLHHHVFDLALLRAVLAETGWLTVGAEEVRPHHLVALARNAPVRDGPDGPKSS